MRRPALTMPEDRHETLRRLTLLSVGSLTVMAGATIAPALPGIERHFSRSSGDVTLTVKLVLTAPALAIALSAPLAGWVIDRVGRRRPLALALLLYAIGGSAGLFVDDLSGLIASRALLGVAVGAVMTTTTALAGDYYEGPRRARFMGLQAAFQGFGGVVFLLLGGALAERGWRAPFAVYASALLLLPLALAFLRDPRAASASDGARGERGLPGTPWRAAFVLYAIAFFNSVLFYLIPTQLPFYLRSIGSPSSTIVGVTIGSATLSSAVVSLCYASLRRRLSARAIFGIGFLLMAAGFGGCSLAGSLAVALATIALAGAGMGLVLPALMLTTVALAPEHARGRIASGLTTSIFLGQFVSPLGSEPIVRAYDLRAAFLSAAIGFVVLAVASLRVESGRAPPAPAPASRRSRDAEQSGPSREQSNAANSRRRSTGELRP